MNHKTRLSYLLAVGVLAIMAMTTIGISGYNTEKDITQVSDSMSQNLLAISQAEQGRVAGVATTTAKFVIDRGNGNTLTAEPNLTEGLTVLSALKSIAASVNLPLATKDYGASGILVTSIGQLVNGQDNNYWSYYVNGQMANVAADKQVLQPGDIVEFKFAASPF